MNLKSNFFKYALITFGATMAFTSCSDKDEPDNDPNDFDSKETIYASEADLKYDSEGVWENNFTAGNILIDDFIFSHATPYDNYANGFTASKVEDLTYYEENPYLHPYAAITEGGVKGKGTPYLVGYWDSYNDGEDFDSKSCRIYEEDMELFMPQSIMVTNTTYAYYAMLYGNAFSKAFENGSWLKLIIHGVHQDGTEDIVETYLANILTDDVKAGIVDTWQEVDLTSLGICTGIYFTMTSSDTGDYGMNTPSYFCIDKLVVKE